jgi:hypothetical protein
MIYVFHLNRLGKLVESEGDYAQARRWFGETLRLVRELNIPLFAGMMLTNLGRVAECIGNHDEVLRLHREGMCLT